MQLKDLLNGIYTGRIKEQFEKLDVASISCDSRAVDKNSLFVALGGRQFNGADFIVDAVAKGARVVALDGTSLLKIPAQDELCFLKVDNPRDFLKQVSLKFFGNPSARVRTIGVTGTNGKTTFTYLMESILNASGKKSGVIGTINYRIGATVLPSKNTTPGFLENQKMLYTLAEQGVEYCVMEVSSHALDQGRVEAIDYSTAVFTNLTGDHLDYHATMEDYFIAKSKLFTQLGPKAGAVINNDDPYGKRLLTMTRANKWTYGLNKDSDVYVRELRSGFSGSALTIGTPLGAVYLETRFIGKHNIYNILSAVASSLSEGIPLREIKNGIEALKGVPGRLEAVDCGQDFNVFIDYAHTEDGLMNVLSTLRNIGNAKIIVVFGCGGDRDKSKRPKMGRTACEMADHSIITTDNPRTEDPEAIIKDIAAGFVKRNYEVKADRSEAIQKALSIAKKGDVVLIAGKGHETYQIFKDKTIDFNERAIVQDYLNRIRIPHNHVFD